MVMQQQSPLPQHLRQIDGDYWTQFRHQQDQQAFLRCVKRFQIAAAGRRSGKTKILKAKGTLESLEFTKHGHGRFYFAAPTADQAHHIFWDDLLRGIPRRHWWREPNISRHELILVNGVHWRVIGLDRPYRAEGGGIDWIGIDEIAKVKPEAWYSSIRPALDDNDGMGRAVLTGRPAGRNHFYELFRDAISGKDSESWGAFHWTSEQVLNAATIAQLRRDLDPITYSQEVLADFVNFQGRAYPDFNNARNCRPLRYYTRRPLLFCFDFNNKPGVAAVCQLQEREWYNDWWGRDATSKHIADVFTACIGQVWIPKSSNTRLVTQRLINDWNELKPETILVYGDATGGAGGSAKVDGSDWVIIGKMLNAAFGSDHVQMRVPRANPEERVRVNSMNQRICSTDGITSFVVDPNRAPRVVDCFEGTTVVEGGSGELFKEDGDPMTHLSDAIGYEEWMNYPIEAAFGRTEIGVLR